MLDQYDGFLVDLDGTIFRGDALIEGADRAVHDLRARGKKVVFLSNRGNISRRMCREKLLRFGMDVDVEDIILSSTVAALFLNKAYAGSKVWTLGDAGLLEELQSHGVSAAEVPAEADWLVISLFETMTYGDLNLAFQAVRGGARIMATNADKTYPGAEGDMIDVAGMIGAIEAASGRRTDIVIGKPSFFMVDTALQRMQLSAAQCMIVGDSLESDIRMGEMYGLGSALVLTGSTKKFLGSETAGPRHQPDYVFSSIEEMTKSGNKRRDS